jgi:hypothetical protein
MELAREEKVESLTFIEQVAPLWWGSFECPRGCPHDDLRWFCQSHSHTDCYGALVRFLLLEEKTLMTFSYIYAVNEKMKRATAEMVAWGEITVEMGTETLKGMGIVCTECELEAISKIRVD